MTELEIVSDCYKKLSGKNDFKITNLPQSGSERKYFRITAGNTSMIGAYNANHEENEAFIGFTKHFGSIGLNVPEILGYFPEKNSYFLSDLGDTSLFTWLKTRKFNYDDKTEALYKKILDQLIKFQINGEVGLNFELCYPHKSFDRQSMMWDMSYFKYMFLKLLAVPFNERRLEHDFNLLADFLLETGQDYFLYRDFQSANIMIIDQTPWFIDYQGGRKGAPQYDVASLLFDAKVLMPSKLRQDLLIYHTDNFCSIAGGSREEFKQYFTGFSLIRLMQALGAFGFRGLYERKPTFTGSIVPAVKLINELIDSNHLPVKLAELFQIIQLIPEQKLYNNLLAEGNRQ